MSAPCAERIAAAAPAPSVRADWDSAVARYWAAQAATDAHPLGGPGCELVQENACKAMDHLIAQVLAPDLEALSLKLRLALGRAEPFEDVLFHDHARGIIADICFLTAQERARPDPHVQWLADRNRIYAITNTWAPMADGLMDALTDVLSTLEERIRTTPAHTAVGWAAKVVCALQVDTEGFAVTEGFSVPLLHEAARVLGIGHGAEQPQSEGPAA